MEFLSKTVTERESGKTAADVLKSTFAVSESYLRRLKRRSGALLLNGEPVYTTHIVSPGDVVSFDPADPERLPIRPIDAPPAVVYEDEWLLVLDKPKNIGVHPDRDPNAPSIENILAAYFTGRDNPHPVSRLDKGTTGLLTVAKSGFIHARMKTIQHAGAFRKTYLALVSGVPKETRFTVDAPIGPEDGSRYKQSVRTDGAPAMTECETVAAFNGYSLVRLTPHTGRTHQIRIHMAYAGYPLIGDWLYGKRSDLIDRPALHAAELGFAHPITGETLSLCAPLPPDMARLLPDRTDADLPSCSDTEPKPDQRRRIP